MRGQSVLTNGYHMRDAALHGVGLAFLPESMVGPHVEAGRLVSVMEDWCFPFEPLHAFYPSRRHSSRALMLVIDAIRFKE